MRRSTTGSGPAARTRGNFTPPGRSGAPAQTPQDGRDTAAAAGSRMSPRNWRVPTRLNAILLIPVIVGLVMGGFQVKGSVDTWQEADAAERTARLVRTSLLYGNRLIEERDISAAPLLRGDRNDPAVVKARRATDRAADAFDRAASDMPHKEGLVRRLRAFHKVEPGLATLREHAYTSQYKGVGTEEGYVAIQHPLMEIANELGLGTGNITSYGRTVYALSLAKAAISLQRSIGTHLMVKPEPDSSSTARRRVALTSYLYLENIATEEYTSGGTERDVRALREAEKKLAADSREQAAEAAAKAKAAGRKPAPALDPEKTVEAIAAPGATKRSLASRGITPESWWASTTARFDAYRTIESALADKAVSETSDIADDARRDTFITAAAIVIALLVAFLLAGMVARQMSRAMRRLRTAAFGIAEQRLPTLVDQLSRTDPGRVDTRVRPIPITSTDEIGEVARAFDQVHREAVRLAAEQAMLRGNINAIFTNLSRRNQSLIEGQLSLISDLESHEAEPEQLENLFRLDHLATRMRRNGENLLVLAGEEPGRRWDQPVPLVDVFRAAASEVEQYERVDLENIPDAEIHGRAVTDLVHLLAELLENATSFSSPQTKVRVVATRIPDGRVLIEIHDKGIGLTAEDFADINHKLAMPPTVDVAISRRMGLFVVGRLSDRHGIRVQLRPSGEQAGTTSLVTLPEAITHGGGEEQLLGQPEFTVPSLAPEQADPPHPTPLRTTAELGFDDGPWSAGHGREDTREPDPADRSPIRGEHGAALEDRARPGGDRPLFRDEVAPAPPFDERSGGPTAPGQGYGTPRYEPHEEQPPYEGQPAYEGQSPYEGQPGTSFEAGTSEGGHARGLPGREQSYDRQGTTGHAEGPPGVHGGQENEYGHQGGEFAAELRGYAGDPSGHGPQATYGDRQDGHGGAPGGYAEHPEQDGGYGLSVPALPEAGERGGPQELPSPEAADPRHSGPTSERYGSERYGSEQYGGVGDQPHQEVGQDGDAFLDSFRPGNAPEPESVRQAPPADQERVGFDRPGPVASSVHDVTDAGLPRRGGPAAVRGGDGGQQWRQPVNSQDGGRPSLAEPERGEQPQPAAAEGEAFPANVNDERRLRAEQSRQPTAGGVTPSGLPRRVPRANLVEGTAEQSPRGGPQVSRAPEDVRGRLSKLRRGVERGRTAGSDTNGTNSRGSGPDGTYDQER
ncbi:sensor histidine kinase [Streptomyces tsukubensis]|uniref:histidine kinase n=1 Tax=Streptomyces tsukubensis TaxID=83656 RepID=A0A1V3ZZD2_9ACTN|nr:nitrate- and nitrite sensing domain-containing protein [Streptomyces tsukubensis]OON70443.1 ATPase [Streptomyces tsukubensis]QFR95919.1 HAMP domain-containing protein [Streptomyces tsukubensis]